LNNARTSVPLAAADLVGGLVQLDLTAEDKRQARDALGYADFLREQIDGATGE